MPRGGRAERTFDAPGSGKRLFDRERVIRWLPMLCLLPALGIVVLLIASTGVNPFEALGVLYDGSIGSTNGLGVTAIKTTPLLIAGVGVAIGVRTGLWNLGADGQINLGGLGATIMAVYLVPGTSGPVVIGLSLLAGFVGGAAWGVVPALMRTTRGVSEIITTLMTSFIALNLIRILVQGPIARVKGAGFPQSPVIPPSARLPLLVDNTQMHAGIILAFVLTFVVHAAVTRTSFGLDLRAVGASDKAARFSGVPVRRRLFQAMILSAGLAGVAGAVEILGVQGALTPGFSSGYGFDAVAVALLGGSNPIGMVLAAAFFGMLRAGGPAMQRAVDVPSSLVLVTQGLMILAVLVGYGLRGYLTRRQVVRAEDKQIAELQVPRA